MKQILLEIAKLNNSNKFQNYTSGVWAKQLYGFGYKTITDFYDNFANLTFQFSSLQNLSSVKVSKIDYDLSDTLNDCISIEGSFYYDYATQFLYIHFINNTRQLDKDILIGIINGYSKTYSDVTENVYNTSYYEERLESISNLVKNIDPSFYGKSRYQQITANLKNQDAHFDNWGSLNLYGTAGRIMLAENPTQYSDFTQIGMGFISNDSGDWSKHTISFNDERKNLEQSVAKNLITLSEFPNAPEGSIDKFKPVVYGKVFKRKCICIDDSATAKFLFVDTMYNSPVSLDGVYIDGVLLSESIVYLLDGTFELTTTDIDNVYASFTMPITNGVEIILDLMENSDNKKFLSTYYNVDEVNIAKRDCYNTSLYIDDNKKLKDAIESICFDCSIRYFYTDDGKITMRLYNVNREPSYKIYFDDWIDTPSRKNNGDEYLTSATIKWYKVDDKDEYERQYVNTDYYAQAYSTYKKEKSKEFETGLYEESAAIAKSNNIMQYSSNITDIFERTVSWNFKDIELCDFVLCAPFTRVSNAENETLAVHEVIGISKDLEKWQIKLTLRYVKPAPVEIFGTDFSDGSFDSTIMSDGSQTLTENMQITERL